MFDFKFPRSTTSMSKSSSMSKIEPYTSFPPKRSSRFTRSCPGAPKKKATLRIELFNYSVTGLSSSKRILKPRVSFQSVEIQEYGYELGDHPTMSGQGPPLALSWKPQKIRTFASIDHYETYRYDKSGPRLKMNQIWIPGHARHQYLTKIGYTREEIGRVVYQCMKIRIMRAKSVESRRWDAMAFVRESIQRKVKKRTRRVQDMVTSTFTSSRRNKNDSKDGIYMSNTLSTHLPSTLQRPNVAPATIKSCLVPSKQQPLEKLRRMKKKRRKMFSRRKKLTLSVTAAPTTNIAIPPCPTNAAEQIKKIKKSKRRRRLFRKKSNSATKMKQKVGYKSPNRRISRSAAQIAYPRHRLPLVV